jgi:hypothetical protein
MNRTIRSCATERVPDERKAKYIRFELAEEKLHVREAKTQQWIIVSVSSNDILGVIKWNGPWRQYVFHAGPNTFWSVGCLNDVQEFIDDLMLARKDQKGLAEAINDRS